MRRCELGATASWSATPIALRFRQRGENLGLSDVFRDRLWGGAVGVHQANQSSSIEGRDTVGEANHLLSVRGCKNDGDAIIRKLAKLLINLRARADIDAPRRLFDQKHARLDTDPFSESHLLLIAATKVSGRARHMALVHFELLGDGLRESAFKTSVD